MTCYLSAMRRTAGDAKLAELGQLFFMLNGFRWGPLPEKYVIVRSETAEEWCVGQLCADLNEPVKVFEEHAFPSKREAERAIELILQERERQEHPGLFLASIPTSSLAPRSPVEQQLLSALEPHPGTERPQTRSTPRSGDS